MLFLHNMHLSPIIWHKKGTTMDIECMLML